MKKAVITVMILLFPFLISAFELNEEQKNMSEQIGNTVQATCNAQNARAVNSSRKEKIKRIKEILADAKRPFDSIITWSSSGSVTPQVFVKNRYYDTDMISQKLADEKLKTFLENDKEALNNVAAYTTNHRFYVFHNDFEALLAIGVSPIEAALRTGHDDYVTDALQKGEITYTHCYREYYEESNLVMSMGGYRPKSKDITIKVNTTEEEVAAVKNALPKRPILN